MKLSSRLQNKAQGKIKTEFQDAAINKSVFCTHGNNMSSNLIEATKIIDTAVNMGLEVVGGREEGIKSLLEKLPARGSAGGLLSVWDKSLFELLELSSDENWIRCKLEGYLDGVILQIIYVYSPQELDEKKRL